MSFSQGEQQLGRPCPYPPSPPPFCRMEAQRRNLSRARRLYRRALEVDPLHIQTLLGLGQLEARDGKHDQAREVGGGREKGAVCLSTLGMRGARASGVVKRLGGGGGGRCAERRKERWGMFVREGRARTCLQNVGVLGNSRCAQYASRLLI